MTNYKNDPRFEVLFEKGDNKVYFLKDKYITEMHKSREVEAQIQNIYSNAGATAEYINKLSKKAISMLENDPKNEQLRQTQISLWRELQHRTQKPIDSLCGVRMGAILSFMDGEPEEVTAAWIDKKIDLALSDPEIYTFFLGWGIGSTPSYSNLLDILSNRDYFHERKQMLMSLSS